MFVQSLRVHEVLMQSSSMKPKTKLLSGESATGVEGLHQVNLTPCVLVLGVDFCTTLQHTVSAFYCMSPKTDRVQCCTP